MAGDLEGLIQARRQQVGDRGLGGQFAGPTANNFQVVGAADLKLNLGRHHPGLGRGDPGFGLGDVRARDVLDPEPVPGFGKLAIENLQIVLADDQALLVTTNVDVGLNDAEQNGLLRVAQTLAARR